MRTLHPHQSTMLNQICAMLRSTTVHAGVAIAPPAFGKTSVIVGAIDYIAGKFNSPSKTMARAAMSGASLMLTPYLILNQQQTEELDRLEINYSSDEFRPMPKMVGTFDSENMTTSESVSEFISLAHSKGRYPVIVSTYKSAPKLAKIKFDAIICDEAHHVCEEKNYDAVFNTLDAGAKKIFLTATPRLDGDLMKLTEVNNRAMNNIAKYGPFISMVTFKAAIKNGYVLKPKLVFMNTHGKSNFEHYVVDMVVKSIKTMKDALAGAELDNKVIFVCESIAVVESIKDDFIRNPERYGDTAVFTAHSDPDGYTMNGKVIPGSGRRQKQLFGQKLKNHEGDCILVHVDTMGEGVDIPGFTGVVFINTSNTIRVVQNLGRAMRIHYKDRGDNGLAKPSEERIKKHALVGVITYNDDDACKLLVEGIVRSMRQDTVRQFAAKHLDIPLIERLVGKTAPDEVGGGENLITDTQRLLSDMMAQAEADNADDDFIAADTVMEVDNRIDMEFDNSMEMEIDPLQARLKEERLNAVKAKVGLIFGQLEF